MHSHFTQRLRTFNLDKRQVKFRRLLILGHKSGKQLAFVLGLSRSIQFLPKDSGLNNVRNLTLSPKQVQSIVIPWMEAL